MIWPRSALSSPDLILFVAQQDDGRDQQQQDDGLDQQQDDHQQDDGQQDNA